MTARYAFPTSHFDRLQNAVRPYMGEIRLALVGGSQVLQQTNGVPMVAQNSDTDVLLLSDHVAYPVSLTITLDNQRYDLICRDRPTLAFDFHQSHRIGRGTLTQIATTGQVVMDTADWGRDTQLVATQHYHQGPFPISTTSAEAYRRSAYSQALNNSGTGKNEDHRLIAGITIAHDVGSTVLRLRRIWGAKGKIVGRKLHEHRLDDLNQTIMAAFNTYAANNPDHMLDLIISDLPILHVQGEKDAVPLWQEPRVEHITEDGINHSNLAAAFTNARMNSNLIGPYLHGHHPAKKFGARQWLYWKCANAAAPITPDRIGRASNEYFYAVAKLVGVVLKLNHLLHVPHQSLSLEQSITSALALDRLPNLGRAVRDTLEGRPQQLLAIANALSNRVIGPDFDPASPRFSPDYYRLPALQRSI